MPKQDETLEAHPQSTDGRAPLWFKAAYWVLKPRPYTRILNRVGLIGSFLFAAGMAGYKVGTMPSITPYASCVIYLHDGSRLLVRHGELIAAPVGRSDTQAPEQALSVDLAPNCSSILSLRNQIGDRQ
jgi:hypothetical protein